ncbi:hypothetical protein PR048_024108 [Dryococelus australis]|uniref:Uncharacterized protein n=1 Tax=Dryococelus australis TaxID=614101 RepID=A0ABQ9GVZ2_9NEOP|nr:hypothetical protein PR048_024108 [Dryococelus australis]
MQLSGIVMWRVLAAVRRQLARQRGQVDDDAWALDAVTRDLSTRVEDARDKALLLVRGLADVEYWRWFTGLGTFR